MKSEGKCFDFFMPLKIDQVEILKKSFAKL
jgi:hypothetical protein